MGRNSIAGDFKTLAVAHPQALHLKTISALRFPRSRPVYNGNAHCHVTITDSYAKPTAPVQVRVLRTLQSCARCLERLRGIAHGRNPSA